MTVDILLRPEVSKKAYRMKCRFTTPPMALTEENLWKLKQMKDKVAEEFIKDMESQGWEWDNNVLEPSQRGFTLSGPFPYVPITGAPSSLERQRFSARQAQQRVMAGDRMRSKGKDYAVILPNVDETDKWQWEISGVFIHSTILVEQPDAHEERK